MEDYEKFKLNKSNIVFIVITIILVIVLIVASIMLIISLKKPNEGLPKLNVTSGRYTTGETTLTTATAPTTTTKKIVDSSPYYEMDVDKLFSDELYTKRSGLTRDEAEKIGRDYLSFANSLYDVADYSIFDLGAIENNVKEGETDLITVNGVKYGELYNFDKVLEKMFVKQIRNGVTAYSYMGKQIIMHEGDKYYKALNFAGTSNLKIAEIYLESFTQYQIVLRFTYYNANYRELGYSSPNYTNSNIILKYEERWKIASYSFPLNG